MKHKIIKYMMIILSAMLLFVYIFLTAALYRQLIKTAEKELQKEACYAQIILRDSGMESFQELDSGDFDTRRTLIDSDGTVLYDSWREASSMDNHGLREEVEEAARSGSGQFIRHSDTISRRMVYYAQRLEDGRILRVSKNINSVWQTALYILPFMLVSGCIILVSAWFFTGRQVNRLIQPINTMDLEEPLANDVYEELSPLLARLDIQNKEKEKTEQMRREFSANVSHELKTPLTSISGYAEIMMNGLVKAEDISEFSGRIYKEANRMVQLVEDIIKLSKLDEENIELEKEDVDLFGIAKDVCGRLALKAERNDVHLELTGESVIYRGIRQILDEMIYNICENAVKYNRLGGHVYIWTGNTLNGRKVIISDTGIGIPKEHQERIFERFYRVDKSHSRETGGTGLGLSIVKHGAILHRTDIRLESQPGEGTKMELNFH